MSVEYHVVQVEPGQSAPADPRQEARARLIAARAADPTRHFRLIAVTLDERTGERTSQDTGD